MAEVLLINPRPRRKSRRGPSPAQKRARAAFAAASRARARRRRNPIAKPIAPMPPTPRPAAQARRVARRVARRATYAANPLGRRHRRRRNPISLGSSSTYMTMVKDGLIGGAGALAVDLAMGQLNNYLPSSLQRVPGQVGVGDAVKAVLTVAMGQLLAKPTRGYSRKAAQGALVVQAHGILAQFLPGTMTLGYAVPARVANMSNRVGPNSAALGRFTRPGSPSPMLSRFTSPGTASPLLSRASTMARESIVR